MAKITYWWLFMSFILKTTFLLESESPTRTVTSSSLRQEALNDVQRNSNNTSHCGMKIANIQTHPETEEKSITWHLMWQTHKLWCLHTSMLMVCQRYITWWMLLHHLSHIKGNPSTIATNTRPYTMFTMQDSIQHIIIWMNMCCWSVHMIWEWILQR